MIPGPIGGSAERLTQVLGGRLHWQREQGPDAREGHRQAEEDQGDWGLGHLQESFLMVVFVFRCSSCWHRLMRGVSTDQACRRSAGWGRWFCFSIYHSYYPTKTSGIGLPSYMIVMTSPRWITLHFCCCRCSSSTRWGQTASCRESRSLRKKTAFKIQDFSLVQIWPIRGIES